MEKTPMNYDDNQGLIDLVAKYETLREQGEEVFWEEKTFLQVIEYYEREHQWSRAIESTDYAIQKYAYSADFYLKKAQLLIEDDQEAEALNVLAAAKIFAPFDPEIDIARAEALARMGLPEEALELLETMKENADKLTLANIYVCEASVYESSEEYEQMYDALRVALRENPRHEEALEQIWLCVETTRKYEESVVLHQEIIEADPYSYLAWYNLGHAQAYLGNYQEAIEAYEYAFLTNENFEFAYRDCAEMCFEIKQYRKALQCYEEMLERFEVDSELYYCIGQCHQQLADYDLARTCYAKALHLDPFNDEILFCIGECYAHAGKWKSAIRAFKKAIDIEDSREEYFAALGEAYFETGETQLAETNFKKAIKLAPDQIQYWMQYTGFLIETDHVEKALATLQKAENYSTGAELLYCRIACLFALDRRQEALYWLGEALEEDFELHEALFEILPSLRQDDAVTTLITSYLN
jgi:tetratricopeptide (TPR) repeat protein